MRSLLLLFLAASTAATHVFAQTPAAEAPEFELFAARPNEERLADKLMGMRIVATPAQLADPGFPAEGVDVTRVAWIDGDDFVFTTAGFMDEPVSRESLDRLVMAVRLYARTHGKSFVSIYLPPQDITGGYVQIVASEATHSGEVAVQGAKYFSEKSYRNALSQEQGKPIDEARLRADVEWLNRNPFRRAVIAAEPGEEPGTTRLALRVQELAPWQLSASYDNTGTKTTGEDRVSASVLWGNALGLGHQMSYRFTADPELEHSRSHSLSYAADLPWRHSVSVFAAWSDIKSIMPEPFTQEGSSGQAGVRYVIPLRSAREGWVQSVTLGGDFKYSDNTLEFAALPVTDNVTHIVQGSVAYALDVTGEGQQAGVQATVFASPGGLSGRNHGRYFDASRNGAKAEYVYGRIDAQYSRALPARFFWSSTASLQVASGALLGSEQLNGGGAYAVRGFRENTAFGDEGVVLNNELHLPGHSFQAGSDNLDTFVFVDAASLRMRVDEDTFELSSAGVGVNYAWKRNFTLRAAYGWQWKKLPGSRDNGHGHVSANVSW
jgi:hemolysin activation/secretion protein